MPFPTALPTSRVPDPMLAPPLRWGILGTGWIAERFVAAVKKLTQQHIRAVGSRSQPAADAFGQQLDIPERYGSYSDLVNDPQVDVIYVATPHPAHLPGARLALQAGKAVLVEKPLALNAIESRVIAELAAARGLFCAEAMWTLFLPKFDVIRQLLDDGALGGVHTVLAEFGEWFDHSHRIFRADLAGGPLLDMGTYPLTLATWVLGSPDSLIADGTDTGFGVTGQVSAVLRHGPAARSVIHTTILGNTPNAATITGDAGTLTLATDFLRPGGFAVESADRHIRLAYDEPRTNYDGMAFEAAEVARCITAGDVETPYRPLADSISTLAVIDEIRRQLGIVFDQER